MSERATTGKQMTSFGVVRALNEKDLGLESRARRDDHLDTRMWLRLLSCCNQIERRIRSLLREHFGVSLSRFDYLAQLERSTGGTRMSVLSQRLMVTGGNVTGLTHELIKEGWISRKPDPTDHRAWLVDLTPKGRAQFKVMAKAHERWLISLFGELDAATKEQLYEHLGLLRVRLRKAASPPKRLNRQKSSWRDDSD